MSKFYRTKRDDIRYLCMGNYHLAAHDWQRWYETPKSYELWENEPLRFIKRFPKRKVLLVETI